MLTHLQLVSANCTLRTGILPCECRPLATPPQGEGLVASPGRVLSDWAQCCGMFVGHMHLGEKRGLHCWAEDTASLPQPGSRGREVSLFLLCAQPVEQSLL